jgi:hypothetical protein
LSIAAQAVVGLAWARQRRHYHEHFADSANVPRAEQELADIIIARA